MSRTWNHPRLGTFEHDDIWWRREIAVPSLQSFTYIDAAVRAYRSKPDPFELVLQCESEDEQPGEQMASLAATVLHNEGQLVPKVLEALWSDLNGRGPDSGMWWRGDLPNAYRGGNWASAVHDSLTGYELPVPTGPEDLKKVLEPKDLTIRRHPSLPEQWIAEFNFHAGFDVEHGVGVLTDGKRILGIGYASDASLFES
jgi:hypothetical protein